MADALLLVVVWWALRRLPVLLTRVTAPAMAVGAVCATVIGLLVSQLARIALDDSGMRWGLVHLSASIGGGVPAALTFGLVAGAAATVTLRVAGGGRAGESGSMDDLGPGDGSVASGPGWLHSAYQSLSGARRMPGVTFPVVRGETRWGSTVTARAAPRVTRSSRRRSRTVSGAGR